jgi:secondary thiamine-phosphate synthase enzyme
MARKDAAAGEERDLKMIHTFQLRTSAKTDFIDISPLVQQAVEKSKVEEGICYVFVPHTTAAVTINENADRHVSADLGMGLSHMAPDHEQYQHLEGNSPAHIKSSLVGTSQVVLVQSKKLLLGTWQGIFFCEFDGPRHRQVHVKVLKAEE